MGEGRGRSKREGRGRGTRRNKGEKIRRESRPKGEEKNNRTMKIKKR